MKRKRIESILIELGIPPGIKGFSYIRKGLEIILENPNERIKLCDCLYVDIANEFNSENYKVERAVRYAISRVDTESEAFKKYVAITDMTASTFLYTLAYHILEHDDLTNTHTDYQEIIVNWNGYNFCTVCGHYKNGWFVAIPNWEICVEIGNPADDFYNSSKLAKALNNADAGVEIAKKIKEYWEGMENETIYS